MSKLLTFKPGQKASVTRRNGQTVNVRVDAFVRRAAGNGYADWAQVSLTTGTGKAKKTTRFSVRPSQLRKPVAL